MAGDRQLQIELLLKDKKALSQLKGALDQIESRNHKATQSIIPAWLKVTAAIAGTAFVVSKLIDATVNFGKNIVLTGAKFERFQVELQAFTGSAEEAKKVLQDLIEFSAKTPFQAESVIQAGKILLPFKDLGVDLEEALRGAGNVAAAFGLTIEKAAEQMARSFNTGIASADLFREKGVANIIKVKQGIDLTKLSAEELRTEMVKAFTSGELGQATLRLSKTFEGLMSTLRDQVELVFKDIADAGFFESVKTDLEAVLKLFVGARDGSEEYQKSVQRISDTFIFLKDTAIETVFAIIHGIASVRDGFTDFNILILKTNLKLKETHALIASIDIRRLFPSNTEAKRVAEETVGGLRVEIGQLAKEIDTLEARGDFGPKVAERIEALKEQFRAAREEINRQKQEEGLSPEADGLESQIQQQTAEQEINIFRSKEEIKLDILLKNTEIAKQIREQETLEALKQAEILIKKKGQLGEIEKKQLLAIEQAKNQITSASSKARFQTQISFAIATADLTDAIAHATGKSSLKAVGIVIRAVVQAVNIAMASVNPFLAILKIAATAVTTASALAELKRAEEALEAQRGQSIQAVTNVPGLQSGGEITRRGAVLVGERRPEILELPRGARVKPLDHASAAAGAVHQEIHITIQGDVLDLGDFEEKFKPVIGRMASEFIARETENL